MSDLGASLDYWRYLHILLFVFWLGADVGVYMVMILIRDGRLSFETRAALIKLAFLVDLFPRASFALFIPVGVQLGHSLGVWTVPLGWRLMTWLVAIGWAGAHVLIVAMKGTAFARGLKRANIAFEALAGFAFIAAGGWIAASGDMPDVPWLALKLILFGLIFWVVLGIDTTFQPFTQLLAMARTGSTPDGEAAVRRSVNLTLAWAMLLYVLIAGIAFLGTVKPDVF